MPTRAFPHALAVALFAVAVAVPQAAARAGRHAGGEINLRPPPGLRSRSLEYPWEGRLDRSMRLRESEYVRYVGEYAPAGNFHGTWELVQLLERAARRVAFRVPGARLSVGELSRRGGGRIAGHRSHESGRDADIGFYVTMPDGTPYDSYAFAEFDARGHGVPPNQMLRFDDARNWELVAKLVADGDARVQYIFVARPLRERLLAQAARIGAPRALVARARAVLVQPASGNPHRNHFHVRIYCPPSDRPRCKDNAPYWPWYPGNPPGGEYSRLGGAFSPIP